MQYKLPNEISDQMPPFFAPFAELWEANLKALETVVEQQTKLLDDVVVKCSELADDLSKADSVESAWQTQKNYSSSLQGLCVESLKSAPAAFKESEAVLVKALSSVPDFSDFAFLPVEESVAKPAVKKASPKSKSASKAASSDSKKETAESKPAAKKAAPKKAAAKKASAPKAQPEDNSEASPATESE